MIEKNEKNIIEAHRSTGPLSLDRVLQRWQIWTSKGATEKYMGDYISQSMSKLCHLTELSKMWFKFGRSSFCMEWARGWRVPTRNPRVRILQIVSPDLWIVSPDFMNSFSNFMNSFSNFMNSFSIFMNGFLNVLKKEIVWVWPKMVAETRDREHQKRGTSPVKAKANLPAPGMIHFQNSSQRALWQTLAHQKTVITRLWDLDAEGNGLS